MKYFCDGVVKLLMPATECDGSRYLGFLLR